MAAKIKIRKTGKVKNPQAGKATLNLFVSVLIGLVAAGLFSTSIYIFATSYVPSGTLDPECAPGASGCTVAPPLTDSFSNNFAGTGDLTTTGSFHVKNNNTYQYFGSADQAKIYYNGTNLVVDPGGAGTNILTIGSGVKSSYLLDFYTSVNHGQITYTGTDARTGASTFDFGNNAGNKILTTGLAIEDSGGTIVYTLPTTNSAGVLTNNGTGTISWGTNFGAQNLLTTGTLGAGAITGTTLTATAAGGLTLGTDAATNIAGYLKLWGTGANDLYTTFTTGTQTANATYTLPTAMPSSSSKFLQSTTAGVLSWEAIDTSGLVPYTGATTNVDLGVYGITAGNVNINGFDAGATLFNQGGAIFTDGISSTYFYYDGTYAINATGINNFSADDTSNGAGSPIITIQKTGTNPTLVKLSDTVDGGTAGYFESGTNTVALSNGLYAINATGANLFSGSITASEGSAIGTNLTPTLLAAANNDILSALTINPTFTNGEYTSVKNYAINATGENSFTNSGAVGSSTILTGSTGGGTYIYGIDSAWTPGEVANGAGGVFRDYSTDGAYVYLAQTLDSAHYAINATGRVLFQDVNASLTTLSTDFNYTNAGTSYNADFYNGDILTGAEIRFNTTVPNGGSLSTGVVGNFWDGASTYVNILDGTYAINATGSSHFTNTETAGGDTGYVDILQSSGSSNFISYADTNNAGDFQLKDSTTAVTLVTGDGTYAINATGNMVFQSGVIVDNSTSPGLTSIDPNNRQLIFDGFNYSVNWSTGILADITNNGAVSVNWDTRNLYSYGGVGDILSLDWENRILYASDGTTPALNWSTGGRVLINGATDDTTSALQVNGITYSGTTGYNSYLGFSTGGWSHGIYAFADSLSIPSRAGYFYDTGAGGASNNVILADGTYAINAVGKSYFSSDASTPYTQATLITSPGTSNGAAVEGKMLNGGVSPEYYFTGMLGYGNNDTGGLGVYTFNSGWFSGYDDGAGAIDTVSLGYSNPTAGTHYAINATGAYYGHTNSSEVYMNSTEAARFMYGNDTTWTYKASLAQDNAAGYFLNSDASTKVYLVDGTYAINATGQSNLNGRVLIGGATDDTTSNLNILHTGYATDTYSIKAAGEVFLEDSQTGVYEADFARNNDLDEHFAGRFVDGTNSAMFADGTYAINATGESYFTNGTLTAYLMNGSDAASFGDGTRTATFANGGQGAYIVDGTNTVYIVDGTYAISATGIIAGVDTTADGAAGYLAYANGGAVAYGVVGKRNINGQAGGFFDDTLGNTVALADGDYAINATGANLFTGSITAVSGAATGSNFTPTLVAAANDDVLSALIINPTFTNGEYTGVKNYAINATGASKFIDPSIGTLTLDPVTTYININGFDDNSGASAGYAGIHSNDGTEYFTAVDGSMAVYTSAVGFTASLSRWGDGKGAGYFTDTTGNEVSLANNTYAISATGPVLLVPGAEPADPVDGELYFNSGSGNLKLFNGGWVTITTFSSLRYKHNVQPLVNDWNKILQVQPKSFIYNGDSEDATSIGYVAEDFDALGLTDLVQYDDKGRPNGINYDKITLYAAEILKQQQIDINAIKQSLGLTVTNTAINQAGTVGSGEVLGVVDQSVQSSLAHLGATLTNGVLSLKQIFADNATIKVARVNQMEMVTPNGDIYCTWIDNSGDLQKAKGECSTISLSNVTPAVAPVAPVVTPEAPSATPSESTNPSTSSDSAQDNDSGQAEAAADAAEASARAAQRAAQQAQQAANQARQANNSARNAANQAEEAAGEISPAQAALNISSIASISDINVEYGSSPTLPTTISVTLSDGIAANPNVTWDAGTPAFNANTAGTYVFSGTPALTSSITNTQNLTATVNVIVAPQPSPAQEEQPAPEAENPASQAGELIQEAAAGLINGVGEFIKWIFVKPVQKLLSTSFFENAKSSMLDNSEVLKTGLQAGLIGPLRNLFK